MDLDRAKKELSNEYKTLEIQVAKSLHQTHSIYSTNVQRILVFLFEIRSTTYVELLVSCARCRKSFSIDW
jgi:hypothetical protein